MNVMVRLGIYAGCIALSGCGATKFGNTFEGAGDYSVITQPPGAESTTFSGKYLKKATGSTFESQDFISISLKSAYIHWFSSSWFERAENNLASITDPRSYPRGQIAIVANVYEGKNTATNVNAGTNGRLIYYSDDVYAGQMLNFSFNPIYGPIRWNGNPLTIELTVIELDQEENKRFKGMLQTVASLGSELPVTGASRLLNSLNRIGDALIGSNADDVIGRYQATFVPSDGTKNYALPVLMEGDLVFSRHADRSTPINWENYQYNEKEGRLKKKKQKGQDGQDEQPDFNYFIVTIGKNLGTIDMTPDLDLNALQEKIANAKSPQDVQDISKRMATEISREASFLKVLKSISGLTRADTPEAVKSLEARTIAESLQCAYLASQKSGSSQEKQAIVQVCGQDYQDTALNQEAFSYFARKLVALKGCGELPISKQSLALNETTVATLESAQEQLAKALTTCSKPD
ncbi:hypothetical protein HW090_15380 [Pseudomonas sp. ABC1]|uniref:hypothetical protein n=1 Tax=Pseudomonas sp. ABC1 TaxID=2748080 RepID=UPI0015C3B388|nr:hypothetical protein [Pseudomonas sp. ABC1]QLF94501.1 hypothetical protein HW090_15380 [Pseudomonas sp. ABC1]